MKKIRRFFTSIREAYQRFPFFRSLKLRIFLLTFAVGLIPSMILVRSILANYESRVVNVRTSEVQTQLRVLSNHLLLYQYLSNPSSEVVNAELTQLASFYDGRVLVIDPDLKVVKDTYGMADGKTAVSEDIVNCLEKGSQGSVSRYVKEDGYIEVIMPIAETASLEDQDYSGGQDAAQETVSGVLLASVSTDSIQATLEILRRRATLMEIILFVLVFSAALLCSNLMVRPFERLTRAISDVKSGFSSSDIQVNDYLETQHIQDAFNQVLGRMRALDESRQEFVSNVSHELKTPMTSMKVLADSLLQNPDTPAEVYRDFLTDIDNEIDRENKIIAELLSLSKMDRRQVQMNIAPVNINNMIETIMKRVRPIAQQRDVQMTLVSEREVTAEVDEVKLSMVFTNLIENAVKYNKDHGSVKVTVDSDHKNLIVVVEDTGIGIPKESQSRVFERFYRVDKSRSREIGGTGLGLSITKSAVLLHKGTITLESQEGVGSKFTVTIPLNYISNPGVDDGVKPSVVKPAPADIANADVLAGMTAPMKKEDQEAARRAEDEALRKNMLAIQQKEEQTDAGNSKGFAGRLLLVVSLLGCLVLLVSGALWGCGSTEQSLDQLYIYYLNQDGTGLAAQAYAPDDGAQAGMAASLELSDAEADSLVAEMLDCLSTTSQDISHVPPIRDFTLNSWKREGNVLTLDFSREYQQQDKIHEILVRAAIVDTLCQVDGVNSVIFTSGGERLKDAEGNVLPPQSADMFINNTGREIQNYERVRLHLYFASEAGDKLVDTYRNVVYNSNISMERLVVEEVLKGPNSSVVYPTLNPETKIISITTRDGVCYVNLDQNFLTDPYNVTPQVAVYSLVNALTELPAVHEVQISVNGETNVKFMDNLSLTTVFGRNEDVMQQ